MMEGNYITIQGWMRDDLGLTGSALVVYAIIYGFSQDGESSFTGGLRYVQSWCGCSINTARKILKSLVDAGYITRKDVESNGRIVPAYKTTPSKNWSLPLQNLEGTPPKIGGVTPPKSGDINIREENKRDSKYTPLPPFDFVKALKGLGVSDQLARDWMAVRKTKRATNTRTAFDRLAAEIAKTGRPAEDCVRLAVENSWSGFKADWMPAAKGEIWTGSMDDYLRSKGYEI